MRVGVRARVWARVRVRVRVGVGVRVRVRVRVRAARPHHSPSGASPPCPAALPHRPARLAGE